MQNRPMMPEFDNIKNHGHGHLSVKTLLGKTCHHGASFLRMELVLSVWIISVHALSCGRCCGCLHCPESPLFAGAWPHQSLTALKGAGFLSSRSPVPFLRQQCPAGPILPSSTSSSCSGTTLSPWTKKGNTRSKTEH